MTVTITLPDDLEAQLQSQAALQDVTVEELGIGLLSSAVESMTFEPTLESVVASIRALPRDAKNIRPAVGSLAEALRDDDVDGTFDLAQWQHDWSAVEAEMRAITRANDIAEGRE